LLATPESKKTYMEVYISGTEPKVTSLQAGTTIEINTPSEEDEQTGF
jgi:hypothetical protein